MYSHLYCGTLETSVQGANLIKEYNRGIKLYRIELLEFQELVSGLIDILSSSEQDRANRYHFTKDKNRFIICRALLKFLLSKHLGVDISEIILEVDINKKPYLPSHPSVYFNVSYSLDFAMIAIADHPVGIDIEYINKEFDFKDILPTVFQQHEMDEIENSRNKPFTFYKFWTRKEAIVKAIGKGIDDDISEIPVTNGTHLVASTFVRNYKKINVFSFNLNDDYMGALALTSGSNKFDEISFIKLPNVAQLKKFLI